MEIFNLLAPRNVVMAFNKTTKRESYLRKMCFDTKSHYDTKVSVDIIRNIIDTVTLGDGKESTKIKDVELDLTNVEPGVFDLSDEFTTLEIDKFDQNRPHEFGGFLQMKIQNVADYLGQLCNTLACKSISGNYKHKSTMGSTYNFKFGTPVSVVPKTKINSQSNIFDLSTQAEEMAEEMINKVTSKEDVRILCSTEYYAQIIRIANDNSESAFVQQIDENGIKMNGWYYINDQATYKDTDKKLYNAVPAGGCVMIDKSQKSQVLLCDLALDKISKLKKENSSIITVDGLPFVVAYEITKAGLLITVYYLAAPIAVPRLSHIVVGKELIGAEPPELPPPSDPETGGNPPV